MSRHLLSSLVAGLVLAVGWPTLAGAPPERHDIPMSDGVHLATDVYLPKDADLPAPAIVVFTPYGRSGVRKSAERWNKIGYVVVSQDTRGRGDSEGSNVVIFQAGGWVGKRDGHTTIQWITEQPWSNGRVATWGGSAVGITQNMTAPRAPDALRAQFVEVAASNLYQQCFYQGGAFRQSMVVGWLLGTQMTKGNLDAFHAHPAYDDFWTTMNPEQFASETVAPGIFIGGWYDIFCQGTINSFVSIQNQGGPRARGACRLIMGPWAHGGFDELVYPPRANVRPKAARFERFLEYHLKGTENGVPEDDPVHYFVMGDPTDADAPGNIWRSAKSWPPTSVETPMYFHANGSLSPSRPDTEQSMEYVYDPAKPVPTVGGQNLILPKGPKDQRSIEDRPDVLLFTTEPLLEPMEITGPIRASLFVESDAPDTDFTVKLTDVYPDGRSMLITDGILRTRYRDSFREPQMMTAGETYEISVDLWSTSIIINRGHRIRVAVSSSNFPRFDLNPNTGRNSWEEKDPRPARNKIHLSAERASAILLPVIPVTEETNTSKGDE